MKQAAYPSYKPTGVDWLEEVPSHWDMKRLRFAVQTNPLASELRCPPDTLVSFVPMDAVGEYGGLALDQEKALDEIGSGYTYFRDDDVVVAKITPCFENGKGALAKGLKNGIAFGTTELHVLRVRENFDPGFLFYLTISDAFREMGEAHMYGAGGQKRVPDRFVKDLRCPVPPIEEQRTIARQLDDRISQIDRLIERRAALIPMLIEKRRALITRSVTQGVSTSAPQRPTTISYLPSVPEHWRTDTPLKYLLSTLGGSTPNTSDARYWVDGEIPWVSPKDMHVSEVHSSEDCVTEEALAETALKLIDPGAVLIVVRGMILAHSFPVAITRLTVTVNQDMKALIPGPRLEPEYLAYLLRGLSSFLLSLVETSAHGTKAFRTDVWSRLILPEPPVEEQREIVHLLDRETAAIDDQIAAINKHVLALREYRAAVITAAVTGKMKVV